MEAEEDLKHPSSSKKPPAPRTNMMDKLGLTVPDMGDLIVKTASTRWLNVTEIIGLVTPATSPLHVRSMPPTRRPRSGDIFLYDALKTPNYGDDHHSWHTKIDGSGDIDEAHVRFKIRDNLRIMARYARSSKKKNMHRRCYQLATRRPGNPDAATKVVTVGKHGEADLALELPPDFNPDLVLVHYLDIEEASKISVRLANEIVAFAAASSAEGAGGGGGGPGIAAEATESLSGLPTLEEEEHSSQDESDGEKQVLAVDPTASTPNEADRPPALSPTQSPQTQSNTLIGQSRQVMDQLASDNPLNSLWDRVMEGRQKESAMSTTDFDLEAAAATAIKKHFTIEMEDDIIQTMKEAMKAEPMPDDGNRSTVDEKQEALVNMLERHLRPSTEEEVLNTMVREMHGKAERVSGDSSSGSMGTRSRSEAGSKKKEEEEAIPPPKTKAFEEMPSQRDWDNTGVKETPTTGSQNEMQHSSSKNKASVDSSSTSSSPAQDVPPQPQIPLPEIVDFTPETAPIVQDYKAKIVLSMSAPMTLESDTEKWQEYVAFVRVDPIKPVGSAQTIPDLLVRDVRLSPVKVLSPFSFKGLLPEKISPGFRTLVLVGVRNMFGANTSPDLMTLSAAVTVALQAECNLALARLYAAQHLVSKMARPTFYSHDEGANIRFLSQMSMEFFEFEGVDGVVVGDDYRDGGVSLRSGRRPIQDIFSGASQDISELSGSSGSSDISLPAPAPAMASIAFALTNYADKPPDLAVTRKPNLTLGDTGGGAAPGHRRSRSSGDKKDTAAKDWLSRRKPNRSGVDVSAGRSVNRHIKMGFMEKMSSVIEAVDTASGRIRNSSFTKTSSSTSTSVGGESMSSPSYDAKSSKESHTSGMSPAGQFIRGLSQLESLSLERLQAMDQTEINSALDGLLIRMSEALVDRSVASDESFDLSAMLNSPGSSGFTLLHYAAVYNFNSIIPPLLARGAKVDTRTMEGGMTALHLASASGNQGIVELLSRSGASLSAMDYFGQSAADHAAKNGYSDLAQWLVDRGAVLSKGESPIPGTPVISAMFDLSERTSLYPEVRDWMNAGGYIFTMPAPAASTKLDTVYPQVQAWLENGGYVFRGSKHSATERTVNQALLAQVLTRMVLQRNLIKKSTEYDVPA